MAVADLYKVLLVTTFDPLADRVSRMLRPFDQALPEGCHGLLASFLPLQTPPVTIVLFILFLTGSDTELLVDTKETLQPDLTIFGSPGLFVRENDDQPAVCVCHAAKIIAPRQGKRIDHEDMVARDMYVELLRIGRRRLQVITAWSRLDQWKIVFQNHFSHNEEPISFISDALYCNSHEKAVCFPLAARYDDVRVVDTIPEALQDIRYFRQSSAAILHAPLHHFQLVIGNTEADVVARRALVSSDLLISLTAHIAHMDVDARLRDQPPPPIFPVGSVTWGGSRKAAERCMGVISDWLPDKSIEIVGVREGSVVLDISATNRDAVVLEAIFEAGIQEALLRDFINDLELPTMSGFRVTCNINDLPLMYADFLDDIINLGASNSHDERMFALERIQTYWTKQRVVSGTAKVIAGSSEIHAELTRCG